jgi:hypothetical protein
MAGIRRANTASSVPQFPNDAVSPPGPLVAGARQACRDLVVNRVGARCNGRACSGALFGGVMEPIGRQSAVQDADQRRLEEAEPRGGRTTRWG